MRIRAQQGGAALVLFAVLNAATSLAMWFETRGPVRPLTKLVFSLVPWEGLAMPELFGAELVLSLVVIAAGVHLRQLGSAGLIRFGAILAMLPLTGLWLLGLPLGLNAFFVTRAPLLAKRLR